METITLSSTQYSQLMAEVKAYRDLNTLLHQKNEEIRILKLSKDPDVRKLTSKQVSKYRLLKRIKSLEIENSDIRARSSNLWDEYKPMKNELNRKIKMIEKRDKAIKNQRKEINLLKKQIKQLNDR